MSLQIKCDKVPLIGELPPSDLDLNTFSFRRLPRTGSHICRDDYLKKALQPYKLPISDSYLQRHSTKRSTFLRQSKLNVEGLMYRGGLRMTESEAERLNLKTEISKYENMNLWQMINNVYFILYIRHSAVNYLVQNFQHKIAAFQNTLPIEKKNELPKEMFAWDAHCTINRLQSVDTIYLDLMEITNSVEKLDCLKFTKDLSEIQRLVKFLLNDDALCKNSYPYFKKLSIDVEDILSAPGKMLEQERKDLTLKTHTYVRRITIKQTELKPHLRKIESLYIDPIKQRFHMKWIHDHVEQLAEKDMITNNLLEEELQKLKLERREANYISICSNAQYMTISETYQNLFDKWCETFDKDMEDVENQVQASANKLKNIRDDLNFHKERVAFFQSEVRKIEEKIAQEEQEKRDRQANLEAAASKRPSKRSKASKVSKRRSKK